MQTTRTNTTLGQAALGFLEVLYHTIVRNVRVESGNAALGVLTQVGRMLVLVGMFYLMYEYLFTGMRRSLIRGDFVLFILSGVFLFFLHNNAVSKTLAAGNAVGPMMVHAPMTPMLSILAGALASLYTQTLAAAIILFFAYVLRDGLTIEDPAAALAPYMLAWLSGVVVGLVFLLAKPFAPRLVGILSMVYLRLNLFTSGKFFVANALSGSMVAWFGWNPLFHCIDQMRGALFVNYFPHVTTLAYPVWFCVTGLVLGLMGTHWMRGTVSRSTGKR